MDRLQPLRGLAFEHGFDHLKHRLAGGSAQHILGKLQGDIVTRRSQLVQQRDGIAHRSRRLPGDQAERFRLGGDFLLIRQHLEVVDDFLHRYAPKFMPLAA